MRARLRRWLVLLVAAGSVGAALAIPALGAEDKELKVDPAAATSAPGFTDLDQLTYAQARDRLTQLSEITLPVAIEGLELIDVSGVTLDSNDAGRSLALSGTASLPALHGGSQDVDLLVTAIWPDDTSPAPASRSAGSRAAPDSR